MKIGNFLNTISSLGTGDASKILQNVVGGSTTLPQNLFTASTGNPLLSLFGGNNQGVGNNLPKPPNSIGDALSAGFNFANGGLSQIGSIGQAFFPNGGIPSNPNDFNSVKRQHQEDVRDTVEQQEYNRQMTKLMTKIQNFYTIAGKILQAMRVS
jgi:hypothetical protein